jgi:nicotinate-nucleotide adenylyltransferase
MARAALEQLALERVLWIPTGAPRYREPPVAAPQHRVAMLRLALHDETRFVIDERELSPQASGYTVDTLRALRRELGGSAQLFLLLGGDQYAALGAWREPLEVARLATLAVAARPGFPLEGNRVTPIALPPLAISASEIRARAARGQSLEGLVPPAVANYIQRHNLYR